jgi:dihydroneopterin aldolase
MLTTIFIDQLQIHAPIGWFEEERKNKVDLSISVRVKFNSLELSDELKNTLDYALITSWILDQSVQEVNLLETFAEGLLKSIEKHVGVGLISIWIGVRKSQIQAKGVLAKAHGIEVEQEYGKTQGN